MKVGIEVSATQTNQAGTSSYINALVRALKLSEAYGTHSFQTFSSQLARFMGYRKTLRSRMGTLYHDILWNQIQLPWKIRRSDVDVFHLPANIGPIFCPRPTVVTILDMALFRYPNYFTFWHRHSSRFLIPIIAKRARVIVTLSEHAKSEIVELLQVPAEKVIVTHLGASERFRPVEQSVIEEIKRKYALDQFILVVSTLEPRKNIPRLLQAYAMLRQRGLHHPLVHVGAKGWHYDDILTEVERLQLGEHVRFLGYLPLDDLVGLYNAASLAVYPPLYEGFGLPALEAMQCGCPVVTSNVSSLPEVVGDTQLVVDPYDVEALAEAIYTVVTNPELANTMRVRGITRAESFSWTRCALLTTQAYQQALER